MNARARRSGCQALIAVVLAGVVVGSVLTWVHPEASMATQVQAQVAILVAAVGAILWLARMMPSLQRPMSNAVGELRDGGVAVGRVVRVGWRHLICPSGTACTVLDVCDGDAQESVLGRHLTVYFPAGASGRGGGGVEAKVVAWGPGLHRLRRPKLAVLRTARPLPPSIPRLSLARHPPGGPAHVLLPADATTPDPGGTTSAAAGLVGDDGTELTITQVLPPGAVGAPVLSEEPVLAGGTDTSTGAVVAFVAAQAGSQVPVPPPGTGRSVPLVAADDAQLLLDSVSRRQALKLGAVGAVAVTVGVAVTRCATGPPPPPTPVTGSPPTSVTGVGWSDLFDHSDVNGPLGAALRTAAGPGHEASKYTFDVAKKSGVELLAMLTPELLHSYDFVTCPNDTVRESLEAKIRGASITSRLHEFCHGRMVLLVRRRAVKALQRAGLLFLEQGKSGAEVRFDVQTYFLTYSRSRTWKAVDPHFAGEYPGNPIRIGFSDPCHAGGGELFLATLRQAQVDLQRSGRLRGPRSKEEWLWGEDGPLRASGPSTTYGLLNSVLNGDEDEAVFVYEHDVIAALLKEPKRTEEFFLLRTSPEAGFRQYLLSLTPEGKVVGKAMGGPPLATTLFQQFRLRVNGMDDEMDKLLAGGDLVKLRCPVDQVDRLNPEGGRTVTFQHQDLQRLVSRMSPSAPSSP